MRRKQLLVLGVLVAVVVLLLLPATGQASGVPKLAWSPTTTLTPSATYDYGTQTVASQTPQTFTLTNSGGVATAALRVTLTGSAFTKTADNCTGVSLGPKKSCTVTVQYTPSGADADDTGSLTASSKKPAATATLALAGQGEGSPIITVSCTDISPNHPEECSGSNWEVNSDGTARFTYTNIGDGPTEALALVGSGNPDFSITDDNCTNSVLGPSDTCTFDMNFSAECGNIYRVSLVKASDPTYVYNSNAEAVPLPCF